MLLNKSRTYTQALTNYYFKNEWNNLTNRQRRFIHKNWDDQINQAIGNKLLRGYIPPKKIRAFMKQYKLRMILIQPEGL